MFMFKQKKNPKPRYFLTYITCQPIRTCIQNTSCKQLPTDVDKWIAKIGLLPLYYVLIWLPSFGQIIFLVLWVYYDRHASSDWQLKRNLLDPPSFRNGISILSNGDSLQWQDHLAIGTPTYTACSCGRWLCYYGTCYHPGKRKEKKK